MGSAGFWWVRGGCVDLHEEQRARGPAVQHGAGTGKRVAGAGELQPRCGGIVGVGAPQFRAEVHGRLHVVRLPGALGGRPTTVIFVDGEEL